MMDLLIAVARADADLDGRAWEHGALGHGGVPAKPPRPFVLVASIGDVPYPAVQETSRAAAHDYLLYVFDEPGSYTLIDELLRRLRDELLARVGTTAPVSGVQCTGLEWRGTSRQLYNQGLDSATRYATLRVTASL